MDEFRYSDSILSDSELSIDVAGIIRNLIKVVSSQQEEIKELKEKVETVGIESNKAISQLVNQLKAHKMYTQTEIINQISTETKKTETNLIKKLNSTDESVKNLRSQVAEADKWSNQRIDVIEKKTQDEIDDLKGMIIDIQQQPLNYPTTYSKEEDRPQCVDGKMDISPLIRGMYRDSRRIDGFDELISQTRNECKEVVDSVIMMQENLIQFNHNIHDLSLTDGKLSKRITDSASYFSDSFDNNDKHVSDIYLSIGKVAKSLHSAVTITMESFEQVEAILTRLSSRVLPPLPSFAECQLEIFGLKEEVVEKRAIYDDDRLRFKKSPDGSCPSQVFKDVSVKKLQKKQEKTSLKQMASFNFRDEGVKFNKSLNDETTIAMIVEDLVDNVAFLKDKLMNTEEQLNEMTKQQEDALKHVSDVESTERMLGKFESMLTKLSCRVATLETKPKTVVVKEAKKCSSSISDAPIESPLTARTFTREMSARRAQASTAPITARSQKTSSRIVSDRITSPF